ncbi:MAG: acyltransferase [Thermoleophilia bacterium]
MSESEVSPGRIVSIDLLRLVAAFAVVFIHSHLNESSRQTGYLIFDQAAGFAVPFFFIVSGYFFTLKIRAADFPGQVCRRYVRRLAVVYFAWSLVNIAVLYFVIGYFDIWAQIGPNPTTHLWFFPALIIGLSLLYPFLKHDVGLRFFYLAVPLYIFGLLAGTYALTPAGFYTDFNTRNGPFFSCLFIGIGMLIALKDFRPSIRVALIMLFTGLAVHLGESYEIINNYWPHMEKRADYFVGTVPYATGVMLLALALRDRYRSALVSSAARLVLGLYAIQGIAIIYITSTGLSFTNTFWPLIFPVEVFILSLYLSFLISRVPGVRHIVS